MAVELTEIELNRLAMLLEGEGYFIGSSLSNPGRTLIGIEMTDEDVISYVAHLFGVSYSKRIRGEPRKPLFITRISGSRAREFLPLLLPLMASQRRKDQIQDVLDGYKGNRRGKVSDTQTREIRELYDSGKYNTRQLAKVYNLSVNGISDIVKGKVRINVGGPIQHGRLKTEQYIYAR